MIIFNVVILVVLIIIISIATEQLLIRRLNMSEGVKIHKGMCILKEGYGKLSVTSDVLGNKQSSDYNNHNDYNNYND